MPHNAASRQSHASRDIVLCNGVMVSLHSTVSHCACAAQQGSLTNYVPILKINVDRQLCTMYSVFHNSIAHPDFSGNHGNHKN